MCKNRVHPTSHRVDIGTRAGRNAAAAIRRCGSGARVDFDPDRRGWVHRLSRLEGVAHRTWTACGSATLA